MPDGPPITWTDANQIAWTIRVDSHAISLTNGTETIDLPRETWDRDLYLAATDSGVIIRFQGTRREAGFLLTREAAAPFLSLIGASQSPADSAGGPDKARLAARSWRRPQAASTAPSGRRPLIWPKVSPYSVFALIFASISFFPFVGIVFGLVSATLIVMFFKRVRQTESMRHGRVMVAIAGALLVWGTGLWAFSTWAWYQMQAGPWFPHGSFADAVIPPKWLNVAIFLGVILFSLSVHEAAHAITAWWLGDDFARSQGRVTLNPLSHIDPFGTVLLPILLAASGAPVFGYARPVPVRLGGVRGYRRAHILISLAGPGSNLLMAAMAMSLLLAIACGVAIADPSANPGANPGTMDVGRVVVVAMEVVRRILLVNLFLAFFNMVPIPPLDGSWVMEHLYPRTLGPFYARIRPYGFMIFLGLFYFGAFKYLLAPVYQVYEATYHLIRIYAVL